jgi:3D (Asp-Asp-Asp) domain-containing protein
MKIKRNILSEIILVFAVIVAILILSLILKMTVDKNKLLNKIDELTIEAEVNLQLYDYASKMLDTSLKVNDQITSIEENKWFHVRVTGYTINDMEKQGTNEINASGWNLEDIRFASIPSCAVDFSIIPQNSILEIQTLGTYVAADQGGLIFGYTNDGLPKIDILCPNKDVALSITGNYKVRVLKRGITIK